MEQTLKKMQDLIESMHELDSKTVGFLSSYFEDIIRELKYHPLEKVKNRYQLHTLYKDCNSDSYADFILCLLQKCYNLDDYDFTSRVCGYCFGNLPNDNRIKDLLLKGIKDTNKSNRLRERFFWIFNHDFKEAAVSFFVNELELFIQSNLNNPELVGEIIDFIHWNIKENHQELDKISLMVKAYLKHEPKAESELHIPTRKLLKIE